MLRQTLDQHQPIYQWDPLKYVYEEPTPACLLRLKRDIVDFAAQPPSGLYISPEEEDITRVHALVVGPSGTPYEGGFFLFFMKFPPQYPMSPPRVRIVTTDAGRVRFNPTLYANGKVCLSILGTWHGPPWSPAQGIESVLISIQSLMNEVPCTNEPGFQHAPTPVVERYNDFIQHETIRVAVCGQVETALQDSSECPAPLREQILKSFAEAYGKYEDIVKARLHLTGSKMMDLFGEGGTCQYERLLSRLQGLKEQVKHKLDAIAPNTTAAVTARSHPGQQNGTTHMPLC
ncbi:ubiquitin-conjugating enzyme E2 Z-like [Dermacentor andersoni]|uniref:ubiquitin-conjugating enzyme E2 Z-like n=1 Tax=Dermacentor andersoni TaxID=34620 RepID=UPI003B3AA55D